jgi:hypothetical protein
LFEREREAFEDPAREPMARTNQPEQHVLGLDGGAANLSGFNTRVEKGLPGFRGIAAEVIVRRRSVDSVYHDTTSGAATATI